MAPAGDGALRPGLVGLHDAAAKIGAWCWAERRCFEILGGWVADTTEPDVQVLFATHSRHHAWRAERWEEILPRAYVAAADQLIAAPADAVAFDLLEALEPTGKRVAGHYDVLLRALLAAYEASPAVMNPVTDGPALRAIRIIVGDIVHDLTEAESVSRHMPGGISGLDHLTQLRDAVAKIQVSEAKSGFTAFAFRRWGS